MSAPGPTPRPSWPRRGLWFLGLWASGVVVTGAVALVLRAVLHP